MNIGDKLLSLYPASIPNVDWHLWADDAGNVHIAKWNEAKLGAKPSDAVIRAVPDRDVEAAARGRAVAFGARDRALVRWIASLHGKTEAEAMAEIKALYKA